MKVYTYNQWSYRGELNSRTLAEMGGDGQLPHHLNHEPQDAIDECLNCTMSEAYCNKHCAAKSSIKRKTRFESKAKHR